MNGLATHGIRVSAKRRGYLLMAGLLLVMMLGGTLPVPLSVPYEKGNPDRAFRPRPRIDVPPGMRTVMLGAGLGVFAALTVLGLFSSLVPTFLHETLGVHNLALIMGCRVLCTV